MKEMLAGKKGRDWKRRLEKGGAPCAERLEMDGDPT